MLVTRDDNIPHTNLELHDSRRQFLQDVAGELLHLQEVAGNTVQHGSSIRHTHCISKNKTSV